MSETRFKTRLFFVGGTDVLKSQVEGLESLLNEGWDVADCYDLGDHSVVDRNGFLETSSFKMFVLSRKERGKKDSGEVEQRKTGSVILYPATEHVQTSKEVLPYRLAEEQVRKMLTALPGSTKHVDKEALFGNVFDLMSCDFIKWRDSGDKEKMTRVCFETMENMPGEWLVARVDSSEIAYLECPTNDVSLRHFLFGVYLRSLFDSPKEVPLTKRRSQDHEFGI